MKVQFDYENDEVTIDDGDRHGVVSMADHAAAVDAVAQDGDFLAAVQRCSDERVAQVLLKASEIQEEDEREAHRRLLQFPRVMGIAPTEA